MAKDFKVGVEVYYKGEKRTIVKRIRGEEIIKKPMFQHGLFTGYHRTPRKYELDNGVICMRKDLSLDKNYKPKVKSKSHWDFSKPMVAQDLGDEWDDYAWTADDF